MGLPCFAEECPTYEVRDGRMHISLGGDMCLAMPIHVFLKGCHLGKLAISDWQASRGSDAERVVAIKAPAQH